jgi:major membrane immunogen (membrane-anchored lipoprotein)
MMFRRPVAAAMLVLLCGCGRSDPYAKYTNAQLKVGMTIEQIEQQFGEPDFYKPDDHDVSLSYGPFSVYIQGASVGREVTRYRLNLDFRDGKLVSWNKNVPRQKGTD